MVSFIYGVFIYLFYKFNKRYFNRSNIVSKFLLYYLCSFLTVIGYIDIMYLINKGVYHIYFISLFIIGIFIGKILFK